MVVRTEDAQGAGFGVETPGQLRASPIVSFAEHNRVAHHVTVVVYFRAGRRLLCGHRATL
jgi:hypothetical protein